MEVLRELTLAQRAKIFDRTNRIVSTMYFDPKFNGHDWPALARAAREQVIREGDAEKFEAAVHDLMRQLGTSHTGFFHQSVRRVPGRLSLGATFRKHETPDGAFWMFQDVHEDGPAHRAGIKPLDLLLTINDRKFVPPEQPYFPMGTEVSLTIRKSTDSDQRMRIAIPKPRARHQPYSEPKAIVFSHLADDIGYVKAAIFPGQIGIDVAREMDQAFGAFSDCDRVIIDLRGHLGGGLGVLRLMSYLTPDKRPIGYSVTRRRAIQGYDKHKLVRFDHIPASKLAIPLVAVRFIGKDLSVALVTEGLGSQKFHGRIVLLVNEHTASAGEMVCAFAAENKLATIVGTQTAGRLIGGRAFKAGHGYLVIPPGAAFYTWNGSYHEGKGIQPDVPVDWSLEAARDGTDNGLAKAIDVVKAL